ncbi:MAG: hypothetical protein QM499_10590 [Flavobacteriaceae bacterium]
MIKYLTFLLLIMFYSFGFSQNTEEYKFVIKKTSWEVFKDTILVTKSHSHNSVPPTIELNITERYKSLNILFKGEPQIDKLKRKVDVFCDTNKPKLTIVDLATRKELFEIGKNKLDKMYAKCNNHTAALVYSDSINLKGLLICFIKFKSE